MDLRMLGPLEVRVAGGPVVLGGVKQRAVLAMLALHLNEVVSIDFLVDGLWGEQPPPSAINVVQGYVSRLRKALQVENPADRAAAAVLLRRGPGYLLEFDPEQVDLYRFQRLVRVGAQTLRPAPTRAASILREALGLWRGGAPAGVARRAFSPAAVPRPGEQPPRPPPPPPGGGAPPPRPPPPPRRPGAPG